LVAGPRNREDGLSLPELEVKEQTREELKVQRRTSRDGLKAWLGRKGERRKKRVFFLFSENIFV
jgi:hypothetical protein